MTEKGQTERPIMVDFLMTGPPGPEPPGFIDTVTLDGSGIKVGKWVERAGHQIVHALRLKVMVPVLKGEEQGGPEHTPDHLDWVDDMRVWRITIQDGDQTIWVAAETRGDALNVAESMDYFEFYWDEEKTTIQMMPPQESLNIWMCHNDPGLIPDHLKPYIVEPEEDSEWSYLTISAPCAIWAESLKGRADLLADSEAYC